MDQYTKRNDIEKKYYKDSLRNSKGIGPIQNIMDQIESIAQRNMWGELTIKFKDGKPVHITTSEQKQLG